MGASYQYKLYEGKTMKTFETYRDAIKNIRGLKGEFKVFQIPRDEQGRFTWEKIR